MILDKRNLEVSANTVTKAWIPRSRRLLGLSMLSLAHSSLPMMFRELTTLETAAVAVATSTGPAAPFKYRSF